MASDRQQERVGTGALWEKKGRNGEFWSGEINFTHNQIPLTAKVIVFKNSYKQGNQPDYNVFVDDVYHQKPRQVKKPSQEVEPVPDVNDDIPF